MTKIYLDENLSPYVAQAMGLLCKGYFTDVDVFSTVDQFGKGKPDEEIIPGVGAQQGVLITKDLGIQRSRLQFELCKVHSIGMFFLKFPKGHAKHWDIVKTLIVQWEEIIRCCGNQMPFAWEVSPRGKFKEM